MQPRQPLGPQNSTGKVSNSSHTIQSKTNISGYRFQSCFTVLYNLIQILIDKPVISSASLSISRASCFFCTHLVVYNNPTIEIKINFGVKTFKNLLFSSPRIIRINQKLFPLYKKPTLHAKVRFPPPYSSSFISIFLSSLLPANYTTYTYVYEIAALSHMLPSYSFILYLLHWPRCTFWLAAGIGCGILFLWQY